MQNILKFLKEIEPRKYQEDIFETCKEKNCLVILPTGIGKTLVALMLTIDRMIKFPESKVLFLAPTRPLAEQHLAYFKKHLPELFASLELFTGKINAEKRKKIWQSADIIFSTPQCVDGETIIFTEEGPIKIKKFFEQFNFSSHECVEINKKILGYKDKKTCFVNATKAIKLISDRVIRIETELGNTLECTPEHPLLTITNQGKLKWKKVGALKEKEYVAATKGISLEERKIDLYKLIENSQLRIADKKKTFEILSSLKKERPLNLKLRDYSRFKYNFMPINIFFKLAEKTNCLNTENLSLTDWTGKSKPIKLPRYFDERLGYILGAMLGDGHIGNRVGHGSEVVFSDLDRREISSKFKKTIKELFGEDMKEDKKKGLVSYNSALSTILSDLGVPKGKKTQKIRVPKFIFFSPIECISGFIKGIFDTDGNAGSHTISISSASKDFLEDLKWLFLKLGIIGRIEERINKGTISGRKIRESTIYTFRFSGMRQIEKFLGVCKPEQSKCIKLREAFDRTKRPFTRSKEILPIPELLKKIYVKNKDKFPVYLTTCLSNESLKKISSVSEGKENECLKELLTLPIRWLRIKSIKEIKEERTVYDFTIENDHNFITNHLISHNCIANDTKNNLYNLEEVSLLIEDECHRCLKNYAYTFVAQKYREQAKNPRILGLTASPGHEKSKINEICKNLEIEAVEIRTRESEDVKEYLQKLKFDIVKLDFPEEFNEIRNLLKKLFDKKVEELKNRKLLFAPATKKYLLELQSRLMRQIGTGSRHFNILSGASACAQTIKLQHALELLETQTLGSLQNYIFELFDQAKQGKSKAVQQIVKQPEFNKAYIKLTELLARKIENPKLQRLKEIVEDEIKKKKNTKIIVFAQYRDTVVKICKELNSIENVKARVFIGQAKKTNKGDGKETGLSQREQQGIIKEFSLGMINVIAATAIGEEGLDLPEVNAVIFYEPIPSAIRQIQRRGRTARLIPGKLIILMIKGTRDEGYYWAAFHKEKKMYKILDGIKEELENNNKKKDNEKKEKQESLF